MKTLKYCCVDFHIRAEMPKYKGPNFRIVKTMPFNKLSLPSLYACYFTLGYEEDFSYQIPIMIIYYCPFCGQKLRDFYNKDEYVHEIEGETFKTL